MGYCPYMCVYCGDIEDNGWDNTQYCTMVISQHYYECKIKNLNEIRDECNSSYDVCNTCFHNLGYSSDEDYGSEDEYNYPNMNKNPYRHIEYYKKKRKKYNDAKFYWRVENKQKIEERLKYIKELNQKGYNRKMMINYIELYDKDNNICWFSNK